MGRDGEERKRRRSRSRSPSRRHKSKHKHKRREKTERSERSGRPHEHDRKDSEPEKKPEVQQADIDLDTDSLEAKIRERQQRVKEWQEKRARERALEAKKLAEKPKEEEDTAQAENWSWEDDEVEEDDVRKKAKAKAQQALLVNPMDAEEEPASAPEPAADGDDEIDELDALMADMHKEVAKIKKKDKEREKTMQAASTKKGERMFQNQDAMEYSSEEEPEPIDTSVGAQGGGPQYWSGYTPKQRKELGVADHSKIAYAEFRKNFYNEVPDIARMSEEDVAAYRLDMERIKVKGRNCPRPIKTWTQCGVQQNILALLKRLKYEKPTPIQCQAIPAIMSGRDLIGIAKTGSGKTLAFLLPLFRHVLDQPALQINEGPIALCLTPTRELALQTYNEARKFAKVVGLRVTCVYGGTNISEQIADLKRGAEIIVCTPGRMIDMLTANNGRVTNLRRTTYAVLDEADRMFDLGFEPQVMRILDNIRPDRQTVMFSATFPRQMEALARRILKKPIEVQVGGRSVVSETIEQHVLVMQKSQKFYKLLELLGIYQTKGSVLVFTHRQAACDILLKDLMGRGYPCMALHGGIDQEDRDSNIRDFKNGDIPLLIATSVAARGLDVKQLNLVVNFDCPNHYEDYVHRVGRTGRAGKKGTAYTFVTEDEASHAGDIINAMELSGTPASAELKGLWDKYRSEHKNAKRAGGFGGHGFKFDEAEEAKKNQIKMLTMKAHGIENEAEDEDIDSDDDFAQRQNELTEEIDEQVANLMKKSLGEVASGASVTPSTFDTVATSSGAGVAESSIEDQRSAMQEATAAVLAGRSLDEMTGRSRAAAIAMQLNQKYGFKAASTDGIDASGAPVEGHFEEEVEINDFPQQARWKVTRKEYVQEITEFSGAAITVRGSFYDKGKKPKGEERKLYLFIEGQTQASVTKAKAEIERILRDELHKKATTYQPQNQRALPGRYKVLSITG